MTHRATAVASRSVELALRGESFKLADIRRGVSDAPSRQTIYRVLSQLEADEWIEQDGKYWRPAFKSQLLADVDDEAGRERRGFALSASDLFDGE